MKNILVTGSNGQLGTEIQLLKDKYPYTFTFTDIDQLNITEQPAIEAFLKKHKFDIIINCAAYTAVDKAENDKEHAYQLNAIAVRNLAEQASKQKVFLIHISTDYVFNGKHFKPYTENDSTQPTSIYGRTKFEGEIEMLFNTRKGIIIRTSWLYSPFGHNFLKTMIKLSQEKESIGVVFDQIGTPTYAHDLAKAILDIVPETDKIKSTEVFHYANEGACSWYDFAKEIMEITGSKCAVKAIESSEFPTPVIRPPYSVLNKSKFKKTFKLEVPYWKDSLKDCIKRLNK